MSSKSALLEALRRTAQRELPDLVGAGSFDQYQLNPGGFFRDVLGIPTYPDEYPGHDAMYIWPHQLDFSEAVAHVGKWKDHPVTDRVAIATCHSAGKDFSTATVATWFLNAFTPSIVISTAPTKRQVQYVLWGEIHRLHRESKQTLPGRLNLMEWKINEKHYALGFTSEETDPERFAGFHAPHILFIVDEASGVHESIYEAIEGNLASGDARLLAIGNPLQSSGQFYRAFHEEKPQWKTIQLSYEQTPNFGPKGVQARYFILPQWVEQRRKAWGEDSALWQVRVLGQFPTEGTDTLIPLVLVEQARLRDRDRQVIHEIEMGVDIARFGDDETCVVVRQGKAVNHIEAWSKRDLMATAHRIKKLIIDHRVRRVRIDVIGMGGGPYDRLKEMQDAGELSATIEIIPINVAEKSTDDEKFKIQRDELWFGLAQRFRDGDVDELPDDPVLQSQLTSVKYDFNARGQLEVESKEQMKKRGLSSPDRADALVLAFAPSGARITKAVEDAELAESFPPQDQFFGNLWNRTF